MCIMTTIYSKMYPKDIENNNIPKLFSLRMFCLAIIVSLLVIYTISVTVFNTGTQFTTGLKNRNCYQFPVYTISENVEILDDILNVKVKLDERRSIFFLMTGCSEKNIVTLSASQSCAIESAGFHNPNRSVFVLFASPVGLPTDSQSKTLTALQTYKNVHFLNMNIDAIVEGTPAEEFYRSGQIFKSKYLIEHMSDFLRLVFLYKYGGIYLDTDAIVQKNFDELPANFLGKEAHGGKKMIIDSVNNAVLGFQDDVGHEILELCLNELKTTYKPNEWSYNGPQLFTRVLKNSVCHTSLAEMTPEKCREFKVFGPGEFYALNYDDWPHLLDVKFTKAVLEATKNSSVVHLWNHFWRNTIIEKSSSKTAYEAIVEKNCPKVYEASGKYL